VYYNFIKNCSKSLQKLYKKFKFDKKTCELLALFENAKNADGNNINFDLETALDLINHYPEKVITTQLKYLAHRYDANGKAVGSGYLIKLIKSHSMEEPAGYTTKVQKEQENKQVDLYTKIISIWGYNERIGHIGIVYKYVTKKVEELFNSGNLEVIKEKIKETSKLINPWEVIKKDYLDMVEVV
jgi:hypothetical protein